MTKADVVKKVGEDTGIEKVVVEKAVEAFMEAVKESLAQCDNVYLRGFGSFIVKKRASKVARNISKNTTVIVPEHFIPSFKPADTFIEQVKEHVK
jgi:DNA-binding protein HU-beta